MVREVSEEGRGAPVGRVFLTPYLHRYPHPHFTAVTAQLACRVESKQDALGFREAAPLGKGLPSLWEALGRVVFVPGGKEERHNRLPPGLPLPHQLN